jgi:hypothetical protein
MKAETWLPILTLVLGWGLAQVTEVLRDRRATNRDRLARRAELQRMTLLELQEALADLGWASSGVRSTSWGWDLRTISRDLLSMRLRPP